MMTLRKGDRVHASYEGDSCDAVVSIASPNGRSLVISWDDGMLGGHIGMMPILQDEASGEYRSLIEGKPVILEVLKTEVALAFLELDGQVRQTCVGCSAVLEERGMVRRVMVRPLNATQPEYITVVYALVPPYTLENCKFIIKDRHVGPPEWGG